MMEVSGSSANGSRPPPVGREGRQVLGDGTKCCCRSRGGSCVWCVGDRRLPVHLFIFFPDECYFFLDGAYIRPKARNTTVGCLLLQRSTFPFFRTSCRSLCTVRSVCLVRTYHAQLAKGEFRRKKSISHG